ncbi:hypothetical protein [uncultured Tessaracoccus sp.]|uniref:hypothetical protein n=1 Tax=uncultured Tessaracoccus sp. TaxID=905023 RepID=UPI0026307DDC|nr:hypothetical protein [uncultured Tessaracoccus sp.]
MISTYEQMLYAHEQPRVGEVAAAFVHDPDLTSYWCIWALRAALVGQEHKAAGDDLARACAADAFDVEAAQRALIVSGLARWDALMDEYIDTSRVLYPGALSEIAEVLIRRTGFPW